LSGAIPPDSDTEKTFASRRDARIHVDFGFVFHWEKSDPLVFFSEGGMKTMVATEATEATEVLARASPATQYGEEYEPRKTRKKGEPGDVSSRILFV